jgi:hypothetical protein
MWARIERHLPTDVRAIERVDDRRVIGGIIHGLPRAKSETPPLRGFSV